MFQLSVAWCYYDVMEVSVQLCDIFGLFQGDEWMQVRHGVQSVDREAMAGAQRRRLVLRHCQILAVLPWY